MTWTPEIAAQLGNALITAQNALTGYAQLSNAPETEEHHHLAQQALEAVREAIRAGGILEQQGIVEPAPGIAVGDTVRLTDEAYRAAQPSLAFKNGEVVELRDGQAVVDWLDPALPREVDLAALEKVVREKPAAGWVNKLGGFEVGDRVQHSARWLREKQAPAEIAEMKGKILELREGPPRAKVLWDGEEEAKGVLLSVLSKVKVRGVADG